MKLLTIKKGNLNLIKAYFSLDYIYNVDVEKFIDFIALDKDIINHNMEYGMLEITLKYNNNNTIKKLTEYFTEKIQLFLLDRNNIELDFYDFIRVYTGINLEYVFSTFSDNTDRNKFIANYQDDIIIYYINSEFFNWELENQFDVDINNMDIDILDYLIRDIIENKLYSDYDDYLNNNLAI